MAVGCTSPGHRAVGRAPGDGPGDSLARLLRRKLTASDPVPVGQAISCELMRLQLLVGESARTAIFEQVEDTIYTANDRIALHRADSVLGGRTFMLECGGLHRAKPPAYADSVIEALRSRGTLPDKQTGRHITARYEALLREQLVAADPWPLAVAARCERRRVMLVLGAYEALPALWDAWRRAYPDSLAAARDRATQALYGHTYPMELPCDSLARAGMLGDKQWPAF
jgi:hypothetical protein